MYIKNLTGAYAGQIRDIAFDAAARLIANGDAVAVDYNPPSFTAPSVRSERVESVSLEGKSLSSVTANPLAGPKLVPISDKSSKKKSR